MSEKLIEQENNTGKTAEQDNVAGKNTENIVKTKAKADWKTMLTVTMTLLLLLEGLFHVNLVPSGSMYPTIDVMSITISQNWFYGGKFNNVKRGDIISFTHDGKLLCKRVIGIAGDTIEIPGDGNVYLNGEQLDEPYVAEGAKTMPGDGQATYTIPEGCVFCLGDNRSASKDARYWDDPYVSVSDVRCHILIIIPLPLDLIPVKWIVRLSAG